MKLVSVLPNRPIPRHERHFKNQNEGGNVERGLQLSFSSPNQFQVLWSPLPGTPAELTHQLGYGQLHNPMTDQVKAALARTHQTAGGFGSNQVLFCSKIFISQMSDFAVCGSAKRGGRNFSCSTVCRVSTTTDTPA